MPQEQVNYWQVCNCDLTAGQFFCPIHNPPKIIVTTAQTSFDEALAAVQEVEKHVNPEWKKKAREVIHEFCTERPYWSSDDFWEEMGKFGYVMKGGVLAP